MVIDFGVAKATSGKLMEETMSTDYGAVGDTLEPAATAPHPEGQLQ